MIKLVIFDCDGTLVDSEPLQIRSYLQAYREVAGLEVLKEDYIQEVLYNDRPAKWFVQQRAPDIDPEAVVSRKKEIYSDLVKRELKLCAGVIELLESLKGHQVVLASSCHMESINAALAKFGLRKYFKGIYSCYITNDSIPKTELLLRIAGKYKAKPGECVVIEDSPKGLKAAKGADMKCVICPNQYAADFDFSSADLIVSSLTELDSGTLLSL